MLVSSNKYILETKMKYHVACVFVFSAVIQLPSKVYLAIQEALPDPSVAWRQPWTTGRWSMRHHAPSPLGWRLDGRYTRRSHERQHMGICKTKHMG